MSSKSKNPWSDHEFICSATQQRAHTEDEHNVRVITTICISPRAGVLSVSHQAIGTREGEKGDTLCTWRGEWPNAGTKSFTAWLFWSYGQLDNLVSDSRMDDFMASSSPLRYRG